MKTIIEILILAVILNLLPNNVRLPLVLMVVAFSCGEVYGTWRASNRMRRALTTDD